MLELHDFTVKSLNPEEILAELVYYLNTHQISTEELTKAFLSTTDEGFEKVLEVVKKLSTLVP